MDPATPSLPACPVPVGHFGLGFAPGPAFHSGLTLVRYSVKTKVVPLLSERCTTAISSAGSFTPLFKSAILGSFHLLILPRKMPARTSPVNFSCVVTPGRL